MFFLAQYFKKERGRYMNKKTKAMQTRKMVQTKTTHTKDRNRKAISANREYKSSVFKLLFNDKEKLIELYNAIERTN